MPDRKARRGKGDKSRQRLRTLLLEDLRQGNFQGTMRRDLREMYDFYLDEDARDRLSAMGRMKRWLHVVIWLLKSLVRKLSPTRRILLIVCLVLYMFSDVRARYGAMDISIDFRLFSFVLLLIILMLELKDKLLAHDELKVGRAVQIALLPKENPGLSGWDIWLYTRPANDVGGDLVDFIRLESGRVALFLGDVVGKGLGAALLMAKLQSTLRTLIPEEGSLEDLGRRTNQIFCRDGLPGKFATAVYLEIGPDEGQVQVLNAGHLPPVVLHCGTHESLPPVAMPFGILSGESYHEQSLAVPPGGLLLAYSDGLTEAFNEAEECFGDERVEALFPALEGRSAEAAGQFILQAVDRFIGDRRPSDDLSLIVLRRWAGSESTSAS